METTGPLLLILVLLFSVSGVRATVDNSEDDFEENNQRVDAEQDPYTKVTLAPKSGDAISTLFRRCLESSRTFDAKFASIETPGGSTYIRYVPDSSMLAIPVTWENAVGGVSDIFGCTSVAEAGGYSMFKYSASGCQLSRQEYDLGTVPECEDDDADAVFIKFVVPTCCPFPYTQSGTTCDGTSVTVIKEDSDLATAKPKCIALGAALFSPDNPEQIPAMRAYLASIGNSYYHWTDALQEEGEWHWNGGTGRVVQAYEWGTPPTNTPAKQCAYFQSVYGLGETACGSNKYPLCVKPASWCL